MMHRRHCRCKADIKGNGTFCHSSIFHSCSLYHRSVFSFVRCHRDFSDLWFLFNVLFCNLIDVTVCVLPKAALHDPCKNDLFCQKSFAACVVLCFFISGIDVFRNRCIRDENPPFYDYFITARKKKSICNILQRCLSFSICNLYTYFSDNTWGL